MSLQDEFRQARSGEEELVAAGRRIAEAGGSSPECPTNAQLMFFVAGRFNAARAGAIAVHLADCDWCTVILEDIRAQQGISKRRVFRKRVFAAVAAVVLVGVLLAIWLIPGRGSSGTVTADLRNITRGVETSPDFEVVLHRDTRRLRVLLVPQAVEGRYEIAIFNAMNRTTPVLTEAASSIHESDSVTLEAPLRAGNLEPGPYLLGIRHDNSVWMYYPIQIE